VLQQKAPDRNANSIQYVAAGGPLPSAFAKLVLVLRNSGSLKASYVPRELRTLPHPKCKAGPDPGKGDGFRFPLGRSHSSRNGTHSLK
jgi:hypothetical protein